MKYSLFAAFGAVAVAGTLTLSAQTPTPSTPRPQTPTPSPSTASRTDDKTMTLTGCLKAQDASMDRTTSTPSSGTAAAGKFVLTNIESNSMGTTKPDATTPGSTTPSATSNASGKQYALTADAGVNLAAHVNHQVRVTGKLNDMDDHSMTHADPAARPGDPAKPGTTGRPGEPSQTGDRMAMAQAWATLAVSSVTMLNSSCAATR